MRNELENLHGGNTKTEITSNQPFEGSISEDKNIAVLEFLDYTTKERVQKELIARQEHFEKLKEDGVNPDEWFKKIFGVSSVDIKVEERPYGLYFYGANDETFQKVFPFFTSTRHGGATINKVKYLKYPTFLNMVGFGSKDSADHELTHMFNDMLPLHDTTILYQKMQEDIDSPKNIETISKRKSEQYELWANSVLKDEILARIENDQILQTEEQNFDDNYTGEEKIFTTYEPSTLYDYVSPYKADTEKYGIDPVDRKTSDNFWELYHSVTDPIRKQWLEAYNKNISAIKNAILFGIPKPKIKAVVISEDFQNTETALKGLG